MKHKPITAIFPGSFDPITNGHLDVIRRGSNLFDHLIIAVGQNPDKSEFFTKTERVEMIQQLVTDMPGVTVFVMTSEEYGYVNSTMVRQLALLGGDVSKLIPTSVYRQLRDKIKIQPPPNGMDVPE